MTRPNQRQWDAEEYHRHSAGQQAWARELLPKLGLADRERVLDIGCGDGKVTAEIAARIPRGAVVGIDSSAEMIRFAREAFGPERAPNVSFIRADARELPFDAGFEVVFSNATLHWIIDHRPVLAGIRRSLKPGGRCLLQMGGRGNAAEVIAVLDDLRRRPPWKTFLHPMTFPYAFHGPEEYIGWLREAGLEPDRIELIPKDMRHTGRDGLAGWVRTTWLPYTERVPEGIREQLIAAIVDGYLERHPADDQGVVHLAMVRLEVAAHRP